MNDDARGQTLLKILVLCAVGLTGSASAERVYVAQDGLVVMEAENTESALNGHANHPWIIQDTVEGNLGCAHIEFQGNASPGGQPKSPIQYKFKVDQNGTYALQLRAHNRHEAEDENDWNNDWNNDCYVKMAGNFESGDAGVTVAELSADKKMWGGSATGWGYTWNIDSGGKHKKPRYQFKTNEVYTLTLSGRSKKFNIDQIFIRDVARVGNVTNRQYEESPCEGTISIEATEVSTAGTDRTVHVSWNHAVGALSYDLFMAEESGGPQIELARGLQALNFEDTGRYNRVSHYYTVTANFSGGSAVSSEVAGVPRPFGRLFQYNGESKDLGTSDINFDMSNSMTNTSVSWVVRDTTPFITHGQSGYAGPSLYGILQLNQNTKNFGTPKFNANIVVGDRSSMDVIEHTVQAQEGSPTMNSLMYMQSESWGGDTLDLTRNIYTVSFRQYQENTSEPYRIAIRNEGQWYVSESGAGNEVKGTIENLFEEKWAPLDTNPEVLWTDPDEFSIDHNGGFTQVDAIGYFNIADKKSRISFLNVMGAGIANPSFNHWVEQKGLDKTGDADGDHIVNLLEYAFGGNPNDAADQGFIPRGRRAEVGGKRGMSYIYRELRDPERQLNYRFETTDSLTDSNWETMDLEVTATTNRVDYYWREISAFVPMKQNQKFMRVVVEEE